MPIESNATPVARLHFRADGEPAPATLYVQPGGAVIMRDDKTSKIIEREGRNAVRWLGGWQGYLARKFGHIPTDVLDGDA